MRNNIGSLLTKRAALSPAVEGLVEVEAGRRFTFAELNARANQAAHAFRGLGAVRGERVGLLLGNCAEYVESFFGLAKLGAIVVPLNWRLVADELSFILKDSGVSVLVYGGEFGAVVRELAGRGAAGTAVREWVHVGGDDTRDPFARAFEALRGSAPAAEPELGAADGDELYIMYTSGTTGLPKGAVHTHHSALWACITLAATADQRYRDRYLNVLPLYHVGALTPLTGCVHRGITTIMMRAFDPAGVFQAIERERATTLLAVPAMLNFMLQVPDLARYDCSSLRWIMSGAAPVPVTLIEAWAKRGIEVHQVYGLTESCGPGCLISPEDALRKAGSTGKAFFHTDVRVVTEGGADVRPGEIGEVVVRGPHVMKGYWNRPEATAEAIRDGWLHTGDLATVDEDGFVYIKDRKKDMIISGGENIYPAEVENVILSHPTVREVAVIGQPSAKWGEAPVAVVVRKDGTLSAEEVLAHCQGRLARYKHPKAVVFVDQLPRNPTGKILKRLLRDRFPGPAPE